MTSEGYILLATGPQKYLDLATRCAQSLRHFDASRPIQLLTDSPADPARDYSIFDYVDLFKVSEPYAATLAKLTIFPFARFQRNMFVDADCLLLRRGITEHWDRLAKFDFATPGAKIQSGEWYSTDTAELIKAVGLDHIVQMNSGVFFFKKNQIAEQFFETSMQMFQLHSNKIVGQHTTGALGDEPFLGLAMAMRGITPYPIQHADLGSLMLSTIDASDFRIKIEPNLCEFKKHGRLVRPFIVHFIGLAPALVYGSLCDELTKIRSG